MFTWSKLANFLLVFLLLFCFVCFNMKHHTKYIYTRRISGEIPPFDDVADQVVSIKFDIVKDSSRSAMYIDVENWRY